MYENKERNLDNKLLSVLDCSYGLDGGGGSASRWFNYLAFSIFVVALIGIVLIDWFTKNFGGE